jgi:ABC-type multidrug transport system fused ATPase/permease subunit
MISIANAYILIAILPLMILYYFIQKVYIATSRQLRRIDSTSRSPVYNHFSETISGVSSIRAFGASRKFIKESNERVDFNNMHYFPSFVASRWLAIRLEFFGYTIVFLSALFAVLSRNTLSPGLVGLSITYSLSITGILNMLIRSAADLETNIVSVERCLEYTTTPTEVRTNNKFKKIKI